MRKRYWILIGIVIALGTFAATWPGLAAVRFYFANTLSVAEWQGDEAVIEVPIDSTDRHIIFPAMINGQGPFRFALDTGSPMIAILSSHLTEDLELETHSSFPVGGSGQGANVVGSAVDDIDIQIGGLTLLNQSAVVIAWDQLPFTNTSEPFVDGIIGYDIFRRFAIEIDGSNNVLRIFSPGALSVDPDAVSLPLTFTGRKPYVLTTILLEDGTRIPAKLHLDTGARGSLSLLPGSHPSIRVPQESLERYGWGLSGRRDLRAARLNAFLIGEFRLDDVTMAFTLSGGETTAERQGVLGYGLLKRFDFIIDYAEERLILRASERTGRPFEFDMSGMLVDPDGEAFIVRHVYDNTPAATAGLQPRDRIISVNGDPSENLKFGTLLDLLEQHGTVVDFCLERDALAAPFCVSLSLERLG